VDVSVPDRLWHDPQVRADLSPSLEVIIDEPGRRLTVLLATPSAVVTESRYPAGWPGADPHIHRRHADIFHVVEGALVFLLGPAHPEHRIEAGGTVVAPAGIVHGFRVAPETDAVYLNVHAPGMGFDVYLRKRRLVSGSDVDALAAAHDIYDEPADGGLPAERGVISTDGLVQTWRRWAPPGDGTDRASEVMTVALVTNDR
jgi:quercetin dioxygenase-like cupin family protein